MEGVLVARVNSAPALLAGAFFSDVIRHAPRENCESQIARRFSLFGDVWLSFAATFSTVSGDAAIAEREKRQIEARGEKEKERKADKKERLDRQVKKDETKKAEKKERERQKALATIVKLPRSEHEATLQELSRRLDEDLDGLREELALRRVSRGPSRLTARSCWTRRRRNSDATLSSTTKLLAPSTR